MPKKNHKLRDHNHLARELRGAAYYKNNLQIRYTKSISVIMHNSTNYDCQLFVIKLIKYKDRLNAEKYISLAQSYKVDIYLKNDTSVPIVREMKFIDFFRFLQAEIDTLSKIYIQNTL